MQMNALTMSRSSIGLGLSDTSTESTRLLYILLRGTRKIPKFFSQIWRTLATKIAISVE
jgi:hypothetical protein